MARRQGRAAGLHGLVACSDDDDTFEDDLGILFKGWMRARGKVMERLLDGQTARNWCDVKDTAPRRKSCGEIMTRSFSAAIADLKERYGDDPAKWRWGQPRITPRARTGRSAR
jgi:acyl-homoserine lactone acylase PvdQ